MPPHYMPASPSPLLDSGLRRNDEIQRGSRGGFGTCHIDPGGIVDSATRAGDKPPHYIPLTPLFGIRKIDAFTIEAAGAL